MVGDDVLWDVVADTGNLCSQHMFYNLAGPVLACLAQQSYLQNGQVHKHTGRSPDYQKMLKVFRIIADSRIIGLKTPIFVA